MLNLWLARRDRQTDRKRKVADEFWFQKVVYPESIQPILKYFKDDALKLLTDTSKSTTDRLYAFQTGLKEPLAHASMLAGPLVNLRSAIEQTLEKFEDDVADALNNASTQKINELVVEARAAIVNEAQKYHSAL